LGLGSLQVVGTILAFSFILHFIGTDWASSVVIGMIVSVSSTAIVLQTLQEQGYAKSTGGERAFAVLLFQDMAVIPFLAILPFLGAYKAPTAETSPWRHAFFVFFAVALIV